MADDDQDDTDLFCEALKGIDSGIECHFAYSGKDALQKLQGGKIQPQVVFLDINMPEMNGWECLDSLKKEEKLRDIPVIMYSTSSMTLYGRKAIKSGAVGFYEKPGSFLQLKEFLEVIAGSSIGDLRTTLKGMQLSKSHAVYTE